MERGRELRDVRERALDAVPVRRVRVRAHALQRRLRLDRLRPNLSERNEEELLLREIESRQEVLLPRFHRRVELATPCAVRLDETRVADVLPRSQVPVNMHFSALAIIHGIIGILLGDAILPLLERLARGVCPPLLELAVLVVQSSVRVKRVRQLVRSDLPEGAVLQVRGPIPTFSKPPQRMTFSGVTDETVLRLKVTVVGFEMKRRRFEDVHRESIRWPRDAFRYIGASTSDPALTQGELVNGLTAFVNDTYGCKDFLMAKRRTRNPYRRFHPYHQSAPELAKLLEYCPKDNGFFRGPLPWD